MLERLFFYKEEKEEPDLYKFAKRELEIVEKQSMDIKIFKDFKKEILNLVKRYKKLDISNTMGLSDKKLKVNLNDDLLIPFLDRLLAFKPLTEIYDDDDWMQWNYTNKYLLSHRRSPNLYKKTDGETSEPRHWFSEAIVFNKNGILLKDDIYRPVIKGKVLGREGYVKKFPFYPVTFVLDIEGDNGEHTLKDISQLEKVKEIYHLKLHDIPRNIFNKKEVENEE